MPVGAVKWARSLAPVWSRFLLLGFGLLSAALTAWFVHQGEGVLALVGIVHAVFGLGGFWWNTTRDEPIETRFSRRQ